MICTKLIKVSFWINIVCTDALTAFLDFSSFYDVLLICPSIPDCRIPILQEAPLNFLTLLSTTNLDILHQALVLDPLLPEKESDLESGSRVSGNWIRDVISKYPVLNLVNMGHQLGLYRNLFNIWGLMCVSAYRCNKYVYIWWHHWNV